MDERGGNAGKPQPVKSDAELYAAAMAGGPEAFCPIVERYKDALFGIALARVGDFHAAEDVAQSVLIAAYERLGSLKDPSRLGAWLRSMAIHQSIDHLRGQRLVAKAQDATMASSDQRRPEADLERKELRQRVLAAIGRLSKAQRETTTLFYVNGYSVAQVAAIQEVPVGTVKGRLHQAREKLKKDLIGMVADVLKSEAPREDLPQRVLEVLSRVNKHEHEIMAALRRLGAESAIDGFLKAAESPRADTRKHAVDLIGLFEAPEHHEKTADLLKRALRDPNQDVRAGALRAALERFPCSDERKRKEFVPLIVELLFDAAKGVRLRAAWQLQRGWAADVPLHAAARALLQEPNPAARQAKEQLLAAVLDAQAPGGEPAGSPGETDERLSPLKEKLKSPSSADRADAIPRLLYLPVDMKRKRGQIVPLVVGMLKDRSRRVRWRAAYELCAWAADVPAGVVEKACRAETHAGTRQMMERLLRKATEAE